MQKEFVPYELALKLKELGFDEPCLGLWNLNNGKYEVDIIGVCKYSKEFKYREVLAPLYQQALRWFREKHGIMHRLTSYAFGYQIHLDNTADFDFEFVDRRYDSGIDYKTYEEAELACLDKLIKIVELKQQEQ